MKLKKKRSFLFLTIILISTPVSLAWQLGLSFKTLHKSTGQISENTQKVNSK